jgi:hypothetical protein
MFLNFYILLEKGWPYEIWGGLTLLNFFLGGGPMYTQCTASTGALIQVSISPMPILATNPQWGMLQTASHQTMS